MKTIAVITYQKLFFLQTKKDEGMTLKGLLPVEEVQLKAGARMKFDT